MHLPKLDQCCDYDYIHGIAVSALCSFCFAQPGYSILFNVSLASYAFGNLLRISYHYNNRVEVFRIAPGLVKSSCDHRRE
jgi:hypothetical protein